MRSDSRGTTIIEFALILPVFLSLVFGIFEFGLRTNQINSLRTGSAEGARAAAVGAYGDNGTCTSPGLPANAATARVICLTKARVGLDESKTRVAVVLGSGGYAVGSEVLVCVQYRIESVTGLAEFLPVSDVAYSRAEVRIDHMSDEPLAAGQELPLSGGDWSSCTT